MAHLELARFYKIHDKVPDSLSHYIKAAQHFRSVNEVQAATLFEESVGLCFQTDNVETATKCLRNAFECFEAIGWEDRCNMILERIVSIGRTDIADELSKISIKHKSEILLIQSKDVKNKIKKKKLPVPETIDKSIQKAEECLMNEEYEKCMKHAQEAKDTGEGLLKDQKDAIDAIRVMEGDIKEQLQDVPAEITTITKEAKDALNKGDFKAAKELADKAMNDTKEIVRKREEERRKEEEKRREEERKQRELEEKKRKEEEAKRQEEEKRLMEQEQREKQREKDMYTIMSKLDDISEAADEKEEPRMKISFTNCTEYKRNIWGSCDLTLRNVGKITISDLKVNIIGDTVESKEKTFSNLPPGDALRFSMQIKPVELGDSVPLDIIVTCQYSNGKTISFKESPDGIKVLEKIVEKTPDKVEYHYHSTGHMAIGGQVVTDSVQTGIHTDNKTPPANSAYSNMDRGEKYKIYKNALKKWYVGELDDEYINKLMKSLELSVREHENLEIEAKKEMEGVAL